MESGDNFFTSSRKELEQYVQDRLLLLKMQTAEKTARLVALFFSVLVIALLVVFILLFLSIMGGYFFAAVTGSLYTGFAIVAGAYILLLVLLICTRKRCEKWIMDRVIRIFFDKTNEEA